MGEHSGERNNIWGEQHSSQPAAFPAPTKVIDSMANGSAYAHVKFQQGLGWGVGVGREEVHKEKYFKRIFRIQFR